MQYPPPRHDPAPPVARAAKAASVTLPWARLDATQSSMKSNGRNDIPHRTNRLATPTCNRGKHHATLGNLNHDTSTVLTVILHHSTIINRRPLRLMNSYPGMNPVSPLTNAHLSDTAIESIRSPSPWKKIPSNTNLTQQSGSNIELRLSEVWNTTYLNVWPQHKSWHTSILSPTFRPYPILNLDTPSPVTATTPLLRISGPLLAPFCDPASHLQGDISHFDRHMSTTLKNIRKCSGSKIRNDRVTHGQSYLHKSENMLNTQDLYTHIRLYADTCFLHVALEHILYKLYPDVQRQMTNERDITRIISPPPVTFNWRDSIPVPGFSPYNIPPLHFIPSLKQPRLYISLNPTCSLYSLCVCLPLQLFHNICIDCIYASLPFLLSLQITKEVPPGASPRGRDGPRDFPRAYAAPFRPSEYSR